MIGIIYHIFILFRSKNPGSQSFSESETRTFISAIILMLYKLTSRFKHLDHKFIDIVVDVIAGGIFGGNFVFALVCDEV